MSLQKGDIVQVRPEHRWAHCLAVIDEVKSWGVQAYVTMYTPHGTGPAYVRLKYDDFDIVGARVLTETPPLVIPEVEGEPRVRCVDGVEVPSATSLKIYYCDDCEHPHILLYDHDHVPLAEAVIDPNIQRKLQERPHEH